MHANVQFHLDGIKEQAKQSYGDRDQKDVYLWKGVLTDWETEKGFWDAENVPYIDLSGAFMTIKSKNLSSHLEICAF